jgi:hypothetical protein
VAKRRCRLFPPPQHIPLRVLRHREKLGLSPRAAFATVVTDLTRCHNTWFNKGVDRCYVATDASKEQALELGLQVRARQGWRGVCVCVVVVVGVCVWGGGRRPLDGQPTPAAPRQALALQGPGSCALVAAGTGCATPPDWCGATHPPARVQSDQLRVYGLPIRPAFSRRFPAKRRLRAALGWDASAPAVLLVGGGEGMGPVEKTVDAVAAVREPPGWWAAALPQPGEPRTPLSCH